MPRASTSVPKQIIADDRHDQLLIIGPIGITIAVDDSRYHSIYELGDRQAPKPRICSICTVYRLTPVELNQCPGDRRSMRQANNQA